MSIFIHKDSRVVVQGVTGKEGAFWAKHMKDMGTQVVFGVTPGKEGRTWTASRCTIPSAGA